jgi:predicted DNA-binding transcriptional regulator AlpA
VPWRSSWHPPCSGAPRESDVQFIRTRDVLRMLGVSRTTLWRMVRAGTFPRRAKISARASGHVLEEVEGTFPAQGHAL